MSADRVSLSDGISYPTNNDDERARNIVQGMGLLTLQNIATSVLGFIFLFAVIHLIPTFQYGVYSAVLVTVTITSTIAGLGINYAAARFVAYHSGDDESWDAAKKSLLLSLLVVSVTTALYLVFSPVFSLYFTKKYIMDLGIPTRRGLDIHCLNVQYISRRVAGTEEVLDARKDNFRHSTRNGCRQYFGTLSLSLAGVSSLGMGFVLQPHLSLDILSYRETTSSS